MKKILVTDDAMYIRTILKGMLMPHRYAVFEAKNGQEAVEQFGVHSPDLVLMDITMPVMDGIAATKAIKQQYPGAVIVMCTAMGQQTMVLEAIKAGAKDFIVKPFDEKKVLDCVRKLTA